MIKIYLPRHITVTLGDKSRTYRGGEYLVDEATADALLAANRGAVLVDDKAPPRATARPRATVNDTARLEDARQRETVERAEREQRQAAKRAREDKRRADKAAAIAAGTFNAPPSGEIVATDWGTFEKHAPATNEAATPKVAVPTTIKRPPRAVNPTTTTG